MAAIFIARMLLFVASNKIRNFSNFTLTGYGFSGRYQGFADIPFEKENAFYKTAKKWGINFESHGCVISNEIINQIARSNTEAENNLTLKYGSNWKEKFLKEVDYAYKNEKKSLK